MCVVCEKGIYVYVVCVKGIYVYCVKRVYICTV